MPKGVESTMNLKVLGDELTVLIKQASYFPEKQGVLKNNATDGTLISQTTYRIKFDSSVAPYIEYLEEGTRPHDIPFAFVGKGNWVWWYPYGDGVPFLMGMGGRFEGKFHPGSEKHKDFIKDKCVGDIVRYICVKFQGEVR